MGTIHIKKAQSALEFLIIIAFMMLVFVSFFSVASSQFSNVREQKRMGTAEEISRLVVNQVDLAAGLSDGYASTFVIPETVEGNAYSLQVIDGREVVVIFQDYEHVAFLSQNITGNVTFGLNSITKRGERIFLNS